MTSPTVVSPAEFVASLNELINSKDDYQNGWCVRLVTNVTPGTFKLIPVDGIPEHLVRECCDTLLKKLYPAVPIGLHDL